MQIHPIAKRIRPLIEKRATSLYLCPLQDDWVPSRFVLEFGGAVAGRR